MLRGSRKNKKSEKFAIFGLSVLFLVLALKTSGTLSLLLVVLGIGSWTLEEFIYEDKPGYFYSQTLWAFIGLILLILITKFLRS